MRNRLIYIYIGTMIFIAILFLSVLYYRSTMHHKLPTVVKVEKKRIAMLAHIADNPYWQIVKKGAEDAAKERGCILEYKGPQDASVKESVRLMEMIIAAKPDGILTHVTDEEEFDPLINKAADKEIPVITLDTDAASSKRQIYIGTNNINSGQIAAAELIKKAGFEGAVGVIMGGFSAKNQIERVTGFEEYLKANSNLKVIAKKSSNSYLLEAEMMTRKIIKENPSITSLYCTSALDGVGAARAVMDLDLKGRITIICFDDLPETLEYIKNDVIYCTIVQNPYDMGYRGVQFMMDILQGKDIKGQYITDVTTVTKQNMSSYNVPKRSRGN